VDEEEAEEDGPVVVSGDGQPDEAAELRWIRRKVLHQRHHLVAATSLQCTMVTAAIRSRVNDGRMGYTESSCIQTLRLAALQWLTTTS